MGDPGKRGALGRNGFYILDIQGNPRHVGHKGRCAPTRHSNDGPIILRLEEANDRMADDA